MFSFRSNAYDFYLTYDKTAMLKCFKSKSIWNKVITVVQHMLCQISEFSKKFFLNILLWKFHICTEVLSSEPSINIIQLQKVRWNYQYTVKLTSFIPIHLTPMDYFKANLWYHMFSYYQGRFFWYKGLNRIIIHSC